MVPRNQRAPAARSHPIPAPAQAGPSSSNGLAGSSGRKGAIVAQKYLNNCRSFYSCIHCRTHLANHDELISRSFQGDRSRAYLFNSVINVACGPPVQRELNTGAHAVADIFCTNCGTTIGWKYERAYVDSQKYKEGKFIIELAHVVRENRHLELDKRDMFLALLTTPNQQPSRGGPDHLKLGSISPTSSCHWSPGASLASTSSPFSSSPSSPSTDEDRLWASSSSESHRQRGNSSRLAPRADQVRTLTDDEVSQESPGIADSDEDEELLMFPFYDDLYDNRSSFSSLSTSRIYQKRARRSLYLAASPYDWKLTRARAGDSSGASSPPASVKPAERAPSSKETAGSELCSSVGGLMLTNISNNNNETAASSSAPETGQQIQPIASTSLSTTNVRLNKATSRKVGRLGQPRSKAFDDADELDGETQFEFEHDALSKRVGGKSIADPVNDDGDDDDDDETQYCDGSDEGAHFSGEKVWTGLQIHASKRNEHALGSGLYENENGANDDIGRALISRPNSVSFEEEQFFDCNSDHEVSNSPPLNRPSTE